MPTTSQTVKEIFTGALELESPAERHAYLDRTCGSNADLRSRVEALLGAHDEQPDFLESPPFSLGVTLDSASTAEDAGTIVDRYKLLERIGEGGFGDVYMAEQTEPVRRKVALKIIKLGMDTRQVVARFEAERQALALMDHPNIAKVLDAGATESGRPYFVMELVRGIPATEYCDANNLTTKQRLVLFIDICHAVQHAHQKGIIHRDIKPTNVLVTQQDGRPVPKIIDFGVAKATQQRLTEKTLFTEHHQMVGTPEYMSPEQATFCETDVDTRSDIYSLGVLLYEFLVGTTPFDATQLRDRGYDEICRVIRESDPPTPSRKLSTLGDGVTDVSKHRQSQPAALQRLLRGDLDWIVMKALEKDRTRRYETAHGLARDIERHLSEEPVRARPPSAAYRLQKFARKNRGPVTAAAVVLITLLVGIVLSTSMYIRAERERAQMQRESERADKNAVQVQTHASQVTRELYARSIGLAQIALEHHGSAQARQLLKRCPAALRGWEWDYLNWLSDRSRKTIHGHAHDVTCLSYSPDGKTFASVDSDSNVIVWNAENSEPLWREIAQEQGGIHSVAYSPDAKRLVTTGDSGVVMLWDVETGKRLASRVASRPTGYLRPTGNVQCVAFHPDGASFVTGDSEGALVLWDARTVEQLRRAEHAHADSISSVSFSPDSRWIVSASKDRTIKLWDTELRDPPQPICDPSLKQEHGEVSHSAAVQCALFTRDGQQIFSASDDTTLKLWDVARGELLRTRQGHDDWVRWTAISPDGHRFASVGRDSTLRIWDVATITQLVTLHGHMDDVYGVAYSPDGNTIVTGGAGDDHTIKLWDANLAPSQLRFSRHTEDAAYCIALSGNGQTIFSGHKDGLIIRWDAATGEERKNLMNFCGSDLAPTIGSVDVLCLAVDADSRHVAAGSSDGTVRVWEVGRRGPLHALHAHQAPTRSVAISHNGQWLVSAGADGKIKVWDVETGTQRHILMGHTGPINSVAISHDDRWIASGSDDKNVRIWDAMSGQAVTTLTGHAAPVYSVAFSADATRIVSGSADNSIKLWGTKAQQLVRTLRGHGGPVRSVVFSPNQKRIVSGGDDGTVKLWAPNAANALLTFRPRESGDLRLAGRAVYAVAFSPLGKTILSSSGDGSIHVWENVPPEDGYKLRQTVAVAKRLVHALIQEHQLYRQVIARAPAEDRNIDPEVREVALRIAAARRPHDSLELLEMLQTEVWPVIYRPDGDREEYRLALSRARNFYELDPNNLNAVFALGVALYRVGEYEQALKLIQWGDERSRPCWKKGHPTVALFIAMTLFQLGRTAEAQAEFGRAYQLKPKAPIWTANSLRKYFLPEAKRLINGNPPSPVENREPR